MKLAIFDLDGTLFDTKDVNYLAYQEALDEYEVNLEYTFFCEYCNGRHYLEFLPQIIGNNSDYIENIHNKKKICYKKYLDKAIKNDFLFDIISSIRNEYHIALVTTASRENTVDLLQKFNVLNEFELIVTREDVKKGKPSPEGFLIAMEHFRIAPGETIIYEDSMVGLEAAQNSGAKYMRVYGYN